MRRYQVEKRNRICGRRLLNWFDETQNPGRVARHNGVAGNILGDHAARTHNGVLADAHVAKNGGAGADRRALLDHRRLNLPVGFRLQAAIRCRSPGKAVIDELDPVPDEDIVLNRYALTDKAVTRYLAAASDAGILLDLDKCAYLRLVADFATVQVDELREPDILAKFDVACRLSYRSS
jgi:hypothetical protein